MGRLRGGRPPQGQLHGGGLVDRGFREPTCTGDACGGARFASGAGLALLGGVVLATLGYVAAAESADDKATALRQKLSRQIHAAPDLHGGIVELLKRTDNMVVPENLPADTLQKERAASG